MTPSEHRVTAATDMMIRARGLAITAIRSEPDATKAFEIASYLSNYLMLCAAELADLRSGPVASLHRQGLSYSEIGQRLGISKARAAQLSQPDPDSSALF